MRASFALDYDVLTVEQPHKLYLLVRFQAPQPPVNLRRRGLNLSLVIDRSGSMAGAKIDYTRQAAQFLVQHLTPQDFFSIVLYNDKVETLLAPGNVSNKDAINHLIDQIRVRGTTNLSGGWLEGCMHVSANHSPDMINRVLLMTDGLANRGVTEQSQLVPLVHQKSYEGISTTTMGLGNDFNEDLLMAMANAGGGAFYFIESPEVTPTIFKEELSDLLRVLGQNLVISVEPTSHVSTIHQLNAYPVEMEGRNVAFRLGDIFAEELKTLVIELTVPGLKDIGEMRIATLRFQYEEIVGDRTQWHTDEMDVVVNVRDVVGDLAPDVEVVQSVLLLKAAQARREAVETADKGDYQSASQILRDVADAIAKARIDNDQLQEEREALISQADQLAKGPQSYNEYNRKTMATQAFYSMMSRHDETVMLRVRERSRTQSMPALPPQDMPEMDQVPDSQVDDGLTPTHLIWKDKTYFLKGDIIRLGRVSHNEIVINERGISRFHAQIIRKGFLLFIEDLDSTNGTIISGRRIKVPHRLKVGDEVYLCDEKVIFTQEKSPDKHPGSS